MKQSRITCRCRETTRVSIVSIANLKVLTNFSFNFTYTFNGVCFLRFSQQTGEFKVWTMSSTSASLGRLKIGPPYWSNKTCSVVMFFKNLRKHLTNCQLFYFICIYSSRNKTVFCVYNTGKKHLVNSEKLRCVLEHLWGHLCTGVSRTPMRTLVYRWVKRWVWAGRYIRDLDIKRHLHLG